MHACGEKKGRARKVRRMRRAERVRTQQEAKKNITRMKIRTKDEGENSGEVLGSGKIKS